MSLLLVDCTVYYIILYYINPPYLLLCLPVEWSVFVLRVLTELSLILLVQNGGADEEDKRVEGGRAVEGRDEENSFTSIFALFSKSLLPRFV